MKKTFIFMIIVLASFIFTACEPITTVQTTTSTVDSANADISATNDLSTVTHDTNTTTSTGTLDSANDDISATNDTITVTHDTNTSTTTGTLETEDNGING